MFCKNIIHCMIYQAYITQSYMVYNIVHQKASHIDNCLPCCALLFSTYSNSISHCASGPRIIKIYEQRKRKARDLDTRNARRISEIHKKGSINKHINTKAKVFLPHGRLPLQLRFQLRLQVRPTPCAAAWHCRATVWSHPNLMIIPFFICA